MLNTTFQMLDFTCFLFTYTNGEAEQTENRTGSVLYRGWIPDFDHLLLPPGVEEVTEWSDSNLRAVWKSDADRAIVSYTEGDICITVCPNEEAYQQELAAAARFYVEFGGAALATDEGQPAPVTVTAAAVEVLALRNLLRNVARQLEPGGDMDDPDFQQSMAAHIRAVLGGDEANDFLTCATCQQAPALCRCA